jgi:glutamyl-tRNA reductase
MNEAYFSDSDSFISVLTADMRSVSYNLDIPESSDDPRQGEDVVLEESAIPKTFFAFGLNHKTAPVEIREKVHIDEGEVPVFLDLMRKTLSECVILSTCNRTEIYAVSDSPDIDLDYYKDLLIEFKGAKGEVKDEHFFALISCAACQQLFNVATSIDSKVIGDSQILRQLRGAYSKALDHGFTGKVMHQLLQRAFKLGKQTYNETNIHDGAVSASLAAVELAIEQFGSLRNRTALVIGAGVMARQTAEALANKKVGKLLVTNRTRLHAEEMLDSLKRDLDIEGEVISFESFRGILPDVDVVITSTGSEQPILFAKDFAHQKREAIVVDIAVPRDVDESVADCKNVVLKNIDDLNSIVDGTREKRLKDLPKVRKMIMHEMVDFLTWYYTLPLMPAYEKTGVKPSREQTREVLRIKEFLNQNVSEIHRLYARTNGNFNEDLASHFDLVKRLQSMKQRSFAAGV